MTCRDKARREFGAFGRGGAFGGVFFPLARVDVIALESGDLPGAEPAVGADAEPVADFQGRAGIEAYPRLPVNKRVVRETFIGQDVADDGDIGLKNGVGTERGVPRCL